MPELPDVLLYLNALRSRISGATLEKIRFRSPFVLRTFDPPASALEGKRVNGLQRIGKRIVIDLEDDLHIVIHLMIAGRFRWGAPGAKPPGKIGLAGFDFSTGTLVLTEAGAKRRASIHLIRGAGELAGFNAGGLEIDGASPADFRSRLQSERHTLKRALTDPRLFSGIGNAYSDEILHRARLGPLQMTTSLTSEEIDRLFTATKGVLDEWTERLAAETGDRFPEKVTAFRKEMAMHGRFGQPCPDCGSPVQRIVYAENETNYCPTCQTGGKLLADRSLSRLLHDDWPRSLEELDEMRDRSRLK